ACGDDLDADAAERELVGVVAYLRGIGRTELLPQVEAVRARLTLRQGRVELARSTMTAAGQALLAQRRPERLIEALLLFAEACTERDELGVAMEMLAWGYREAMRAGRPGLSAMVL